MRTHAFAALCLVAAAHLILAAPEKGRKLALVVGINECEGEDFTNLSCAVNDAVEFAKVLRGPACGFDTVTLLADTAGKKPTAAHIREALATLLKGATKKDVVLLALAGHGVRLEVSDPEGKGRPRNYSFFCPRDAGLDGVNYKTGHCRSMINLDDVFGQLEKSEAGVRMVLLDACRNKMKVKGTLRSLGEARVAVPDGILALFSCSRGQVAYESNDLKHGLFFHHVLEGMRGKARNPEGEVTWASLTDHTARTVARDAQKLFKKVQTPAAGGYFEGESPVLARPEAGPPPIGPRADDRLVTNSIKMKLVRIPSGEFIQGSPEEEGSRNDDETPHTVRITKEFHLGVHEVTQGQYLAVMGKAPSWFSKTGEGSDKVEALDTSEFPVESVSWEEAKQFCEKLSALPEERKSRRRYRLPTEAEWEHACRGGTADDKPFGFGNILNGKKANCDGTRPYGTVEKGTDLGRTCKVGSYKANGFGLHDMHGNVWEWCADWHGDYPAGPVDDPSGPDRGVRRVRRGGSWFSPASECRSACRSSVEPSSRLYNLGFRVAMVPAR